MRTLTVTLYSNNGTPDLVSSQSVESRLVNLGRLAWSLDDQLTKISPSDLTCQIADEDGVVWAWIQTQLQTLQGSTQQLFPPWLVVYLDGANVFTGLVDLTSIKRDYSRRIIDVGAQDWSQMLGNISLEGVSRALPRTLRYRGPSGLGTGVLGPAAGYWNCQARYLIYMAAGSDVIAGDYITSDLTGVVQFKVERTTPWRGYHVVNCSGWDWTAVGGPTSGTFSRVASDVDVSPYFTLQGPIVGGTALPLDTVDGLAPGDTLRNAGGSEILVADIDNERLEVISPSVVQTPLTPGDRLYFSGQSLAQLVNENALKLASMASAPFGLDVARYTPAALSRPVLGWLTTFNQVGPDLLHPSDMEPTLADVRVFCGSVAYSGTPEAGFLTSGLSTARNVDWTCQMVNAPARLIPDESPGIAPDLGARNRAYVTWQYGRTQYFAAGWAKLPTPVYVPRAIIWPYYCVGYDYSQFRRVVVTNGDSGAPQYSEQRWSGTAWSGGTTGAWPVIGWYPCSMVPMPGVAAMTGPVSPQGQAMLALATDGQTWALHLIWAGSPITLDLSATLAKGAVLRTTPWGAYLAGPGGFGRITYSAGALSIAWCAVGDSTSTVILPNTMTALDASSIYCFARFDYVDPDQQGKYLSETRLLNLTTTPSDGADPTLFSERVMAGCPRIAVAFRDPSTSRIIGLLGGRMFQVSPLLPRTIERVRVDTLTGQELLEHVGQVLNAIVVPRPSGLVQLVSRVQNGPATPITVDQVQVTQSRVSQHFFSVVRVSGEADDLYFDAYGSVNGGKALEISGNPCLWTEGGCYAVASSLAGFLGIPRRIEEQTWCHENPDTAPPWEAIEPWSPITVNADPTVWLFAGLDYDLIKGEAKVILLERV